MSEFTESLNFGTNSTKITAKQIYIFFIFSPRYTKNRIDSDGSKPNISDETVRMNSKFPFQPKGIIKKSVENCRTAARYLKAYSFPTNEDIDFKFL